MAKSQPSKAGSCITQPDEILKAVAIGVIAMDSAGRITFINEAAAKITGVSRKKALGRPCRDIFKSSLCDADCPLSEAMESGETQYNRDAVFIRHDGRSVAPVKITLSPLLDPNGKPIGGVETIQSHHFASLFKDQSDFQWNDFIGESPEIQRVFDVLKVVSPSPVTILIEGPTGTGKDLLARIIHQQSPRAKRPFIKVNCAALPENLLESEMFGYLRGAFTGAERDKPGRFQLADGGTIFLDEISEMPLSLQAKLLRVLEDKEFYSLGARKTTKVDVRIITACNKALDQQVEAGLFREDLYYRLNVIRVHIPPLSERPQDIPLLIRSFIQKKNVERGTYICRFSQNAMEMLLNHPYPGNVRELENILEHACILCQGDVIKDEHLPWSITQNYQSAPGTPPKPPQPKDRRMADRQRVIDALNRSGWNRTLAAKDLNIDRTTLWRRMKRYGIEGP